MSENCSVSRSLQSAGAEAGDVAGAVVGDAGGLRNFVAISPSAIAPSTSVSTTIVPLGILRMVRVDCLSRPPFLQLARTKAKSERVFSLRERG